MSEELWRDVERQVDEDTARKEYRDMLARVIQQDRERNGHDKEGQDST